MRHLCSSKGITVSIRKVKFTDLDLFRATRFNKRYEKVIIMGTDCPRKNVNLVMEAFTELSQSDPVIGLSNDSGYYLPGMKNFHPFLFDDIRWSSDEVFRKTGFCS